MRREFDQDRIDEATQRPERMSGWNAIFDGAIAEEDRLALVGSTHLALAVEVAPKYSRSSTAPLRFSLSFSATC